MTPDFSLQGALAAGRKAFRQHWADAHAHRAVRRPFTVRTQRVPALSALRGQYFITTEKGLFLTRGGELLQLFAGDVFGVARHGDAIYIATSTEVHSRVARLTLPGELKAGATLPCEEMYRVQASNHSRIHQLGMFGDQLAIAQTSTNSVVLLDLERREIRAQVAPMTDLAGTTLSKDLNHVNSVSQCGELLLFCLAKTGTGALLGVMDRERLRCYAFPNIGVHDVHISGRELYYCDTFGETYTRKGAEQGYLIVNGRRFDEPFFQRGNGYATRGLSRIGDELVVGYSHKGPRRTRFKGPGGLIVCRGDKAEAAIELPFSQIYDVMALSGMHFDRPPAVKGWEEVNALFESSLGAPRFERALGYATPPPAPPAAE